MITREILAGVTNELDMQLALVEDIDTGIGRIDIDSLPMLINTLHNLGIKDTDSFIYIDRDDPKSYMFAGRLFSIDLYELLEQYLGDNYILYKLGSRLCADLYSRDRQHRKHIQHFEILKLTAKGIDLVKYNESCNDYSQEEMALLLCKSPALAKVPFSSDN